jgi:hypothetical protein
MKVDSHKRGRFVVFAALAFIGFGLGIGIRSLSGKKEITEANGPSRDDGRLLEERLQSSSAAAEAIQASLGEAGGTPDLEQVMQTDGLERYAAISRYLLNASGDECRDLYNAMEAQGELDHYFWDMIFLRWAEVDPLSAVKFGKKTSAAMWAWAKNDPDAALEYGLVHNQGSEVLRAISQDDAAKGIELLRKYPQLATRTVWEGVIGGLESANPQAAVEFALDHNVSMYNSMKNWAVNDPEGALDFALDQKDPERRMKSLEQVLDKISENNPARAFAVIEDLPMGKIREDLRNRILAVSVETDPDITIESVRAVASPRERREALRYMTSKIVHSDPDRALELLAESRTESGGIDGDIVSPIGAALARTRPEAALRFCQDSPNDRKTGSMAQQVASHWVKEDPMVASKWIRDQPAGEARDMMVRGVVDGLANGPEPDFSSAAIWANSLNPEGGGQWGELRSVMDRWLKVDREAALRELSSEWMPAEAREFYQSQTLESN